MKVSSLKLDARNVKKHPAKQIEAIAKSIGKYGYIQPIVVDEDFDPSNTFDVLWAFSTRSDPANDIDILRRTWSSSADPLIHPDIPARQKGLNSRALIDACRPYEWKDRFPPVVQTSPELEKIVYEKWPEIKRIIGE